jgi:hypothetical protein
LAVEGGGSDDVLYAVNMRVRGAFVQLIEPTENVRMVLNADGFGLAEEKTTKYDTLVGDEPLLSPEQVLELDPTPVVVNCQ